jgi:hypothetical protein
MRLVFMMTPHFFARAARTRDTVASPKVRNAA